jgi:hypothetical protein
MKADPPSPNVLSPGVETACGCPPAIENTAPQTGRLHKTGCLVCGAELIYFETNQDRTCYYCGQIAQANAQCTHGHFVCDQCHRAGAVEIIRNVCLHSQQADMAVLMQAIRSHPYFRMHGPEHHSMVPAVILTALRNSGYPISDEQIITAIERGQTIVGGSCAFLGACGAAIGAGIALSLVLGANPYAGDRRQVTMQATQKALQRIASLNAPRCCQRDAWLALKEASIFVQKYTGKLLTVELFPCEQFLKNKECIQARCPLWPSNQ